jgi:kumamolisin
MAQNRVELPGSLIQPPAAAEVVGDPPANEIVQLSIILRRRNPLPPPGSRPVITRQEFAERYGANPADVQEVQKFAAAEGLTFGGVSLARRTVVLAAPFGALSQVFSADVKVYKQNSQTFRARSGTLMIPASLEGVIEGIFGFDQRPQARSRCRIFNPTILPQAAAAASYTPVQVAQLYQFPEGATGAGQTIGIIELGGGYQPSDLTTFFSNLGITAPTVTAISVDGAANQPSGNPNSADAEVLLDIEVSGAVAPGAAIVVYFTPNTGQGFLDAITTAVHDETNHPNVISISWGGAESTWTTQSFQSYDQAFQDAVALGVTVCTASGDDGSSDGETDGKAHVDFPSSDPNVLSCGGTTLNSSNGTIQSEVVWNNGAGNGASGGGVSEYFALPSYQQSAHVPVSVNTGFAGRGIPDVAGDGDPNTGYQIYVDGQAIVVGGTSAVAPLWAGLIALLNQQLGKSVGFLNTEIYSSLAGTSAFHDIVSGNNGAYSAGPGWDACTGWGSPDGEAILSEMSGASSAAVRRHHRSRK